MAIYENGKRLTIVKVDYTWDFLLYNTIKKEIQRKWEETMMMAARGYGKSYWAEQIDKLADMLLQIINQNQE